MKNILLIGYISCFFVALMIFFQSLNNAFKKSVLWGIAFLCFPIGTYFYYKKFINEEKHAATSLLIFISLGLIGAIILRLVK